MGGVILLTSFFIFVFGITKVLDISLVNLVQDAFKIFEKKEKTLDEQIREVNTKKKENKFVLLLQETNQILINTNKVDKFSKVCISAVVSMIIGIYIAVLIENYFLVPVLAFIFLTLPFQYVKLTSIEYKKRITQELEVTLSIITSSYTRSENIVLAVEENLEYMKLPIRKFFEEFLIEIEYLNADTQRALLNLKDKIEDDIFKEWVDALIACQTNSQLKSTLTPIISKLSNIRVLSAEINNNMYEPLKEFFVMLILVYGNIPLLYILNKEWYNTLMYSVPGKIVMLIVVLITFVSFNAIIKITKPIEPSMLDEGR